jgi:hypothetical protein
MIFCLLNSHCSELDFLHDLKVNSDNSICLRIDTVFFIELSIAIESSMAAPKMILAPAPLLVLSKEEADDFNKHYEQKAKDGPWDQNHRNPMRHITLSQYKANCFTAVVCCAFFF